MSALLSIIFPIFQPLHDWLCSLLWQGEAPQWLLNLHALLGVANSA